MVNYHLYINSQFFLLIILCYVIIVTKNYKKLCDFRLFIYPNHQTQKISLMVQWRLNLTTKIIFYQNYFMVQLISPGLPNPNTDFGPRFGGQAM